MFDRRKKATTEEASGSAAEVVIDPFKNVFGTLSKKKRLVRKRRNEMYEMKIFKEQRIVEVEAEEVIEEEVE